MIDLKEQFDCVIDNDNKQYKFTAKTDLTTSYTVSFYEAENQESNAWITLHLAVKKDYETKESKIDYLTIEVENNILESLKSRLIESCVKFNPEVHNFKFEYDIVNNYIFCLLTCDTGSKYFPIMYRMLTVSAYSTYTDVYYDGNVAGGYILDDVKKKTLAYVNSIQKDILNCMR